MVDSLASTTEGNIEIGRSNTDAMSVRDALAKHVYRRVWSWVLRTLNAVMDHGHDANPSPNHNHEGQDPSSRESRLDQYGFIGLLDIYGFEALKHNGFDQLLINYANEVLQWHFNCFIFEMETLEYSREGNGQRPRLIVTETYGFAP